EVVAFLKARGELVGQYMPDKAVIRLYDKSKSGVYDMYLTEQKGLHGNISGACSASHFNRIWREECQFLKLTQGRDFMLCNVCTLANQTLHGTPGGEATTDSSIRESTEA
ncbi:unnamed protein product, partial [Pylaiella littoralis]